MPYFSASVSIVGKLQDLGKVVDWGWLPLHPLEHAPEEHPPAAGAPPRIAQEEMNIVERITTTSVITRALFKFSPFFDALRLEIRFGCSSTPVVTFDFGADASVPACLASSPYNEPFALSTQNAIRHHTQYAVTGILPGYEHLLT